MKVLMTADPLGGVWTFALELCAGLVARGDRVVLATLGGPLAPAQRTAAAAIAGVQLEERSFRLEWMAEPWADLGRAGDWLLALEREHRPDIVHLNHLAHGDLPWIAPVLVSGHSCVLSWWQAVHGVPPPPAWSVYRERVTRSLRAADCVAAPTGAMLEQLVRLYGPFAHAAVVPNGRDGSRFHAARAKESLVLCAGRLWDEAKNVHALEQAAPYIDWPICIAGESVSPDGARARVERGGLRRLGALSPGELARWYARAAIYVLPARYEPFGLTALEAALSGCALLLGDIPSLREVWGDAAWYVDPGNTRALGDALAALVSQQPVREGLAARSRAVAARLTPERMTGGYLDLYTRMTQQRASTEMRHVAPA